HISDGLTNTVLIGEKFLSQKAMSGDYELNNDQGWIDGWDNDMIVWSRGDNYGSAPIARVPAYFGDTATVSEGKFGSIHRTGCHVLFCDGTVRVISFNCDPLVWYSLCKIDDGNAVAIPES